MKTFEKTIETVFERKNNYEAQKKNQRKKIIKAVSIVTCACLLLSIFAIGGVMLNDSFAVRDYSILLDINPSIGISVDEKNKVKEFEGLNDDGNKVLEGINIKGESAETALNSVISEAVDQGYISPEANSVLVSIEGADEGRSKEIKEGIAQCISETLSEKSVDGAIIVQEIPSDKEALNGVSEAYGISAGKAQLINQIIEQNKTLTFEQLSVMSIHELNLLRVSYFIDKESFYEIGTPGELAYIGSQKAIDIALSDARVEGKEIEAKLECRESVMLYRVEFETDTNDYRYSINAVTGEILSAEKIDLGADNFSKGEQAIAEIGENSALNAAMLHAEMENSTLIRFKFNRDWKDGTVIYNMFFTDGIKSGRYVMNARTGEILQYSITQEYHDRSVNEDVIGNIEAMRIALAKDGLIEGNVSKCEIVLKADGGSYIYDLTYICNAARYIVQIDAMNGTVLSFEKNVLKDTGAPSVEDVTSSSAEAK